MSKDNDVIQISEPMPMRPIRQPRRALYPDARSTSLRRYRSTRRIFGGSLKRTF